MPMMPFGVHIFSALFLLIVFLLPIILGFTYVRRDADRRGQPGILWALLTIPFGWLALLIYAVVSAMTGSGSARA